MLNIQWQWPSKPDKFGLRNWDYSTPPPLQWVIFRKIGHLATIPILWSNQCKKTTNYKTRMNPRDLQNLIILYCDYIIQHAHKNTKENITHPKQLQSAWRYYCFPCVQNHAPVTKIPSRQTNATGRDSRADQTAPISKRFPPPPQYHVYIDNIFRACGKDSPHKKPRASVTYITIRVNQI